LLHLQSAIDYWKPDALTEFALIEVECAQSTNSGRDLCSASTVIMMPLRAMLSSAFGASVAFGTPPAAALDACRMTRRRDNALQSACVQHALALLSGLYAYQASISSSGMQKSGN
jgi:hypothetical protein